MADSVSVQLYDGSRNCQVKVVDVSDGTGLTSYAILTASTLVPNPGSHMKIRRIKYSILNCYVRLQWDGVTPADIAYLGQGEDILDFSKSYAGGFPNNATTPTGNVIVTTSAAILGSGFTLECEFVKGVRSVG